jgi:hypothetical protein
MVDHMVNIEVNQSANGCRVLPTFLDSGSGLRPWLPSNHLVISKHQLYPERTGTAVIVPENFRSEDISTSPSKHPSHFLCLPHSIQSAIVEGRFTGFMDRESAEIPSEFVLVVNLP